MLVARSKDKTEIRAGEAIRKRDTSDFLAEEKIRTSFWKAAPGESIIELCRREGIV